MWGCFYKHILLTEPQGLFELGYSLFFNALIYLYAHIIVFLIIFLLYFIIMVMLFAFLYVYYKKNINNIKIMEHEPIFLKEFFSILWRVVQACLLWVIIRPFVILKYVFQRILKYIFRFWLNDYNVWSIYKSQIVKKVRKEKREFRGKMFFTVLIEIGLHYMYVDAWVPVPRFILRFNSYFIWYLHKSALQKHITYGYLLFLFKYVTRFFYMSSLYIYGHFYQRCYRFIILRTHESFFLVYLPLIYLAKHLWPLFPLRIFMKFVVGPHGVGGYRLKHAIQLAFPEVAWVPIVCLIIRIFYIILQAVHIPRGIHFTHVRPIIREHLRFLTLLHYLFYKGVIFFLSFLKFVLFKLRLSNFFLVVFKSVIFLFFHICHFFFLNYFYLSSSLKFFIDALYAYVLRVFRGLFYFLKISVKLIIYSFLRFIVPFFYFFLKVFWTIFVNVFNFLWRIHFFPFILIFLLFSWIDLATTYACWLLFLDFISYIVGFFFSIISPFIGYIHFADHLTAVVYLPYYKISFFHGYSAYGDSYSFFYDIYYYLKLKFVSFFPYKFYIYFSWFSNYKNFFIYAFHWNYFFLFVWYFYLPYIYEKYDFIFAMSSVASFLFFCIKYVYNYFIFLGFTYFHWALLWYYMFIKYLNNFLLYYGFFNMMDYRIIKMLIIELVPNKNTFNLSSYNNSINFFIDLFFYYYDYFMFSDLQFIDESQYIHTDILLDLPLPHKYKGSLWRRTFYDYHRFSWNARRKGSTFTSYRYRSFLGFAQPTVRRPHALCRRKLFGPNTWLFIRLFYARFVKRWHWSFFYQRWYAPIWGRRFRFTKWYWPYWFPIYSRYNNAYFAANVVFSWALTFDYDYFTLDTDPDFGDGYHYVDIIVTSTFLIYLMLLISSLYLIASFRSVFFPDIWLPHNSQYYWKLFKEDPLNKSLAYYLGDHPFLDFNEFLIEPYLPPTPPGAPKENNYLFILKDPAFNQYYDNRFCGDMDKVEIFLGYICDMAHYHPYTIGMALRESEHFIATASEIEKTKEYELEEYKSQPFSNFYIEERRAFLGKLRDFLYNLDKTWDFKMPSFMMHKSILVYDYYNYDTNDLDYYIPDESETFMENFTCWLILFPQILWNFFSVDFTSSVNTLILQEAYYRLIILLNTSPLFDAFYFINFHDYFTSGEDEQLVEGDNEVFGFIDDDFLTISYAPFSDYYTYKFHGIYDSWWTLTYVRDWIGGLKSVHPRLPTEVYIFDRICYILLFIFFWRPLWRSRAFFLDQGKRMVHHIIDPPYRWIVSK